MGIKGLNPWIKKKINQAFIHQIPQIHTLFIDAKQFYYNSLDLVSEDKVIPVFLSKIQKIIESFTPADTLFLAMDGPNPAAKFQTQRERKFKRDYQQNFKYPNEEEFKPLFDSEHYAETVNAALIQFLQQQIDRPEIQSKEFLFSSGYAAGESEHKYFQYFRDQKASPKWVPNRNHFIVSNDNDLVFLSLQFTDENFYIIKTFEFNNKEVINYVDISAIRRYFLGMVHSHISIKKSKDTNSKTKKGKNTNSNNNINTNYNSNSSTDNNNGNNANDNLFIDDVKVIHDIIALSFLLGNDFIPPFPDIQSIDSSTFERILTTYVELNKGNNSNYNYLIDNDSFNTTTLSRFVNLLFAKDPIKNQPDLPNSQEMSQMILRTLNFTWIYYTKGVPSWTFYYPFTESPPLRLAASLMVQEGIEFFNSIKYDEVTDPFLKTLVIKPAYSTSNIPWNIYKIKIPPSEIAEKFWPLIEPSQKVPIFNLSEIMEKYKKELLTLTPNELMYNRRDPLYFTYTKNRFINVNEKAKEKNNRFHYSYDD